MPRMPDLLRTERLLLRRIDDGDLADLRTVHCDPAAYPFDGGFARTPEQAAALLWMCRTDWAEGGFGYWHVSAHDGELLGFGGLRRHEVDGERLLNLYYRFRPSAWGSGYGIEIARAAVRWADEYLPELPVVIMTDAGNTPSIGLATKLGFVHSGQTPPGVFPGEIYRRPDVHSGAAAATGEDAAAPTD